MYNLGLLGTGLTVKSDGLFNLRQGLCGRSHAAKPSDQAGCHSNRAPAFRYKSVSRNLGARELFQRIRATISRREIQNMTMKIKPLIVFSCLALAALQVQAESLVDGSATAGKAKALTCAACHGAAGVSSLAAWPNLAGQNAPYLLAQLRAFKNGERKDPVMSTQVLSLTDDDMANLAVYFESLPAAAQPVADTSHIDRGQSLYRGGDPEDKSSACLACHGPTGRGNPAAVYPALQGQHATYTAKQLNDYKSGARTTDGKTQIMRNIAATLDSEDIQALSSYMQGLK